LKESAVVHSTVVPRGDKKIIRGWIIYDWANSVYQLTIGSTIFVTYYNEITSNNGSFTVDFFGLEVINTVLYSWAIASAYLVLAILSPLLSSIADYTGRRKMFMKIFTWMGALSCGMLFFFTKDTLELGVIFLSLGTLGYAGSIVFYNSFLPVIADPSEHDRISAKGYSMGYLGGVILLVLNLIMIMHPGWFGLRESSDFAARISFISVFVWWLGFSQITFRRLPKYTFRKKERKGSTFLNGYRELRIVFHEIRQSRAIRIYLPGYFFFMMGLLTVMFMAASFGVKEIGLKNEILIPTVLVINLVGIFGAWFFARLSGRIGNLPALIITLVIWILICAGSYFITNATGFMIAAFFIGIVMGGTQSLARSTYSKMLPRSTTDHTSFFSFFDVMEKLAMAAGMFTFGFIEAMTHSMRFSVLAIGAFFFTGLFLVILIPKWEWTQKKLGNGDKTFILVAIFFVFMLVIPVKKHLSQNLIVIDSLELVLEVTGDTVKKTEILIELTDKYINNDPEKALDYAIRAYDYSDVLNYDAGLVSSMLRMAEVYRIKSNFQKSVEFAIKAKNLSERNDFQSSLAESLLILGKVYLDLNDYEKSSGYLFESLRLYTQQDDQKGIADALRNIGNQFFDQGNYEKSLEYQQKSLSISTRINYKEGISSSLNNIAINYGRLNQIENIEKYLLEAVNLNKSIGQRLWEGVNYMNLSELYMDINDYGLSKEYLKKGSEIFTELNNLPFICQTHLSYSSYYNLTGKKDSSIWFAKSAFNIATRNKLTLLKREAAKVLQELYYSGKDMENAYKYMNVQYEANDSLQIEKSIATIAQLELLFQMEKEKQEVKLKRQQKDFNYKITIVSLFFTLIILVIVLTTRHRIKSKKALYEKEKLGNEIISKNKELTTNVLSLMRKNEMLSDISQKLQVIEKESQSDETSLVIRRIAREFQNATEHKILEEFDLRFNQVHIDFYSRLTAVFPTLTPGELRICAFLRLNMTTKEISRLTGQQITTLENARYRIRKKMGLANSDVNLISYLSSF